MDKEQVKNEAKKTAKAIGRTGKEVGKKSLEASGKALENLGEGLSKVLSRRETYKDLLHNSTIDDLYARGNEVNPTGIKYKGVMSLVISFFLAWIIGNFFPTLATIIFAVGIYLWWKSPKKQLQRYGNRLITQSSRHLAGLPDSELLLEALIELMSDLESEGLSGRHTATSSSFKQIQFEVDEETGLVFIHFEQEGKVRNVKLTNWNQPEFQLCYVIPHKFDELSDVHLVLHSRFAVSLTHYAKQDWDEFTGYILQDEDIARAFPQVRKKLEERDNYLKAQEEEELLRQQSREDSDWLLEMVVLLTDKDIGDWAIGRVEKLNKNKDKWNMSIYNPEAYMTGNSRYMKLRMKLRNHAEYKDVKKLESTLERALLSDVTISPISSDKGSVHLMLINQ